MLRHVLWLSLSASFPCPSVRSLSFQHQVMTPAAHWKTWLLHVVPNQLVHEQDSSCPPVLSDTQPYWPRKHEMQGTFKAKSLHEPTTWTSYPCDIEIFSKTRWWEPELGKLLRWACRDCSIDLNLQGNSTVFSASDLPAFEAWICLISLDLWYLCAKTGTNAVFLLLINYHQFDADTIHVASFGEQSFEEHLKWNRDDQVSPVFDIQVWEWNETASVWEQLHKILAALWSEERLSWLMSQILKSWHWTWKSLYANTNTEWILLLKVN